MTHGFLKRRTHSGCTHHPETGRRWLRLPRQYSWLLLVGGLVLPGWLAGQSSRAGATRVELETLRDLSRSGSVAITSQELMEIERRLSAGDFSVGDQIMIQVAGVASLGGTFTVIPGPSLDLPDIPTISLAGVLRSELEERLTDELERYVRDLDIRVSSLMRIAMFGAVGAPGFYHLSPNLSLSDAIMSAGGPAPTADMGKVVIRRGEQEIYGKSEVTAALTAGTTLDRMNLHGGDAVNVGASSGSLVGDIGRVVLVLGALAASVLSISALVN